MRFIKTLTAFLLSATLASSAAAAIDSRAITVRRGVAYRPTEANIAASKDTRASQASEQGTTYPDLFRRAPSGLELFVAMGQQNAIKPPFGLYTSGLVSCMGVVVTGTPAHPDSNSFFLMHMCATSYSIDTDFATFATQVQAAQLSDIKGYLSLPDSNNQTPAGWTPEDKTLSDEVAASLVQKMTDLLGGHEPTIVTRPMQPAVDRVGEHGYMLVDPSGNVEIDGNPA
jgi:hypothetical protein